MRKKILLLLLISLTAVSCDLLGIGTSGPLGVVKTVDGGGTWLTKNAVQGGGDIANVRFYEMAFDPTSTERIFAATDKGLLESDDSAESWKQLLSKVVAYDFMINPRDNKNIFVAGIFGDHGKIIRTRDGGTTWEEVYNEASSNNPVETITANPNNPAEIYAALFSGTLIKSIDGGTNWFVLNDLGGPAIRLRYRNGIYALVSNKGLSKSSDGGLHFNSLTNSLTGSGSASSIIPTYIDGFFKLGLDDQTNGVIYLTTSAGLYKTTNDGQSWLLIKLPVDPDSSDKPRAIASTHGGMIAYTSVGSTFFKTLDGGKSWQTQGFPSNNVANKILIDPVLNQITYAGLSSR